MKILESIQMFTLEEMQALALESALERMGVEDPRKFLRTNDVTCATSFRPQMGMSIVVLNATPKPTGEDS